MNKNTVGEYYAEYDEESGLYCIFHTDNDEGHAYPTTKLLKSAKPQKMKLTKLEIIGPIM